MQIGPGIGSVLYLQNIAMADRFQDLPAVRGVLEDDGELHELHMLRKSLLGSKGDFTLRILLLVGFLGRWRP